MTGKASTAIILDTLLATAPLVALAENITFTVVHYLMPDGKKPKQSEAQLVLSDTSVQVQAIPGTELFNELERAAKIRAGTYSKSKHLHWGSSAGFAGAIGIFAVRIFFMKGKHNWITLQREDDFAVLRPRKKNFYIVIAAVESRNEVELERISG